VRGVWPYPQNVFQLGVDVKNVAKLNTDQKSYLFLQDAEEQHGIFNEKVTVQMLGQPERLRLLLASACSGSHQVLICLKLKKLDHFISTSFANPVLDARGWTFGSGHDLDYLENVYLGENPKYQGRHSLPLLWDNRSERILKNSTEEICEVFDQFEGTHKEKSIRLYPESLKDQIHQLNEEIIFNLNQPFYKAGATNRQIQYEKYCQLGFETLHSFNDRLSKMPFLLGDKLTAPDIKLFVSLLRFEIVYFSLFHCNLLRLKDFHHLFNFVKSLFQLNEITATCNFSEIKEHYFKSHPYKNSHRVIPLGPLLEFHLPHDRGPIQFFLK
jgi:putative glutathione S-transferase